MEQEVDGNDGADHQRCNGDAFSPCYRLKKDVEKASHEKSWPQYKFRHRYPTEAADFVEFRW